MTIARGFFALDVRRDIERGLACYGRGAVLEALDAWRQALAHAPRNEEAKRLVELVEQRLASPPPPEPRTGRSLPGALPQQAVDDDRTPVTPLCAWLAPSTHPTELELLVANAEEAAPQPLPSDVSTRPVLREPPRKGRSSASDRAAFQLDQCQRLLAQGDGRSAASAAELALQAAEATDDGDAWALIGPRLSMIERAFASSLGPKTNVPFLVKGVRGFDVNQLDHRMGFLLSCVDGHTDVATLLDICGMPRLEALRALSAFHHRGLLRMR